MTGSASLDRGRTAFVRQAWGDAYAQLTAADREAALDPEDLERLAIAAHLVGRDAESTDVWARAHHAFLGRGAAPEAARCAFWLGFTSLIQGEPAQSGGWLARGQRLLDDGRHDCVERGYLVLLQAVRSMFAGDDATFHATFDQAARIGERFGDPQLVAFGRLGVGEALIRSGQTAQGLALLDEVMVSVTAGEVSPIGVGIVYCAVIEQCHQIFDLRRAKESAGSETTVIVYPDAYHDFDSYRPPKLERALVTGRGGQMAVDLDHFTVKLRTSGEDITASAGRYARECLARGATVGGDAEARRRAPEDVAAFLRRAFAR